MKPARFPWPFIVLLVCLGCLVGSYVPLIQLGSVAGVHIDISLLYITVVIVAITSVKQLWSNRKVLTRLWPWRLLVFFALYASFAALWSPNPIRAAVTTAFLWLMVALASVIVAWWPRLKAESALVRRILLIGYVVVGVVALWQIVGDALGVSSTFTLLPRMYQSGVFGVARPLGFALEPQFFANLLLLPFGWFTYKFLLGNRTWKDIASLVGIATLIVLTLSRGGLIGALVISLVLIVTLKQWRASLSLLGIGLLSIVVGGIIIAGAASLNTRDNVSGVAADQRALNQITLGLVHLPEAPTTSSPPTIKKSSRTTAAGYVQSSTDSRLSMSSTSIALWRSTPMTLLFGVGTGGFGAQLHREHPHLSAGSVANNYYLEMLAELGLVGILLFVAFIVSLLLSLYRHQQWLVFATLLGLLAQWYFFSGNANVIHAWAFIGLSMIISSPKLARRLVQ